jgi:hypothetical protein
VPGGAQAVGLDTLVGKLLRGFRLPAEYVALLVAKCPDPTSPDYAGPIRG